MSNIKLQTIPFKKLEKAIRVRIWIPLYGIYQIPDNSVKKCDENRRNVQNEGVPLYGAEIAHIRT